MCCVFGGQVYVHVCNMSLCLHIGYIAYVTVLVNYIGARLMRVTFPLNEQYSIPAPSKIVQTLFQSIVSFFFESIQQLT